MNLKHEQIDQALNMAITAIGLGLLVTGWVCSAMFFNTLLGYGWIGFLLIVTISVLEFALTLYGTSMDRWIVGASVGAYVYDVLSNIGGLALVFGVVADEAKSLGNLPAYFATNPLGMVICIFMGLFLAILPERMLRLGWVNLDLGAVIDDLFKSDKRVFEGRKQAAPMRGQSIGYQPTLARREHHQGDS